MTIELTTQEAQVLVNLLDIACKAGGLPVAEACLVFVKKIKDAESDKTEMIKKE
mgnify:FL=1|tara:strand:+ start:84 stop:245 length:162 start_codon:yes stop_codon:yes gene_type:complete